MKPMSPLFRIVSLAVLLMTFTVVSGVVSTASALLAADTVDVCCDGTTGGKENAAPPCTTPDCTCALCIHAAVLTNIPAVNSQPALSATYVGLLRHGNFQEHPPSIEYPPESV